MWRLKISHDSKFGQTELRRQGGGGGGGPVIAHLCFCSASSQCTLCCLAFQTGSVWEYFPECSQESRVVLQITDGHCFASTVSLLLFALCCSTVGHKDSQRELGGAKKRKEKDFLKPKHKIRTPSLTLRPQFLKNL